LNCKYVNTCPIFARFKSEGAKNFWISLYCTGSKQERCERFKLREWGKDVPITLLPNGKHLESLAD